MGEWDKPGEDRRSIRPSRPHDAPAFTWFLTVGLPHAADSAEPISFPRFVPLSKGTAVSNTYQKDRRRAQPDRPPGEVAVPEQVIVSMAEIAESARRRVNLVTSLQTGAILPALAS